MKYAAFPRPTKQTQSITKWSASTQAAKTRRCAVSLLNPWHLCLLFVKLLLLFHQSLNQCSSYYPIPEHDFAPLFSILSCPAIQTKREQNSLIPFVPFFQLSLYPQPIPHLTTRIDTPLLFPSTHPRETLPLMVCIGNSTTPTSSTSTSQHVLPGT